MPNYILLGVEILNQQETYAEYERGDFWCMVPLGTYIERYVEFEAVHDDEAIKKANEIKLYSKRLTQVRYIDKKIE